MASIASPHPALPHSHAPTKPGAHILHPPTPPHSSPSSPSSTHSSSSAIFERDIEPLSLSSLPAPRDHTLAAFVPSVLDEAIEALTAADGVGAEDVEVEVAGPSQEGEADGFRRSPSPPGIPAAASLAAARPPLAERQSTTPFIPGGFNPVPAVVAPTGLTTPPSPGSPHRQLDPLLAPFPTTSMAASPTPHLPSTLSPAAPTPRVPSASAHPSKRLSFLTYSDLLHSSPVTSLPLSQVTSPQQPPPHLSYLASAPGPGSAGRSREQSAYGDEGGEWEREKLGRGLDERLEEVLKGREGKA
ncbi:hypothetical protein CALCODRAFT_519077 [Calocera cornea HHB12733]|uniref:Uncharacterized protein n=1 Tax=Calocera cornea HHB12733 TaxID=1353952 RepID=A0A165EH50_9BASI|nr:hypothetical protein CALCODRAFT_519077 [Calocera cornea HHB12733]